MRVLSLVLLCLLPIAAAAGDAPFPALYDVRGVADDDVLNVRAGPSATTSQIGMIAPDRRGVEVIEVSPGGGWGRVNTHEWSGWVSMRYLARQPGQDGSALPLPLRCHGTEPFWTLLLEEGRVGYATPEGAERAFSLAARTRSENRADRYGFVGWGAGGDSAVHGSVRRQQCSDGMSDRLFGYEADVLLQQGGVLRQISGCCTAER